MENTKWKSEIEFYSRFLLERVLNFIIEQKPHAILQVLKNIIGMEFFGENWPSKTTSTKPKVEIYLLDDIETNQETWDPI